jgi:uncharacterized protein (TIGR00255 family)
MTGFGRASFQLDERPCDVEVRSVNHRYLDVRVRLPRLLAAFEGDVRAEIQARFGRGKFDLSVNTPGGALGNSRVDVDIDAARRYLEAAEALSREGVEGCLDLGTLLGLPGVSRFVEPELAAGALRGALFGALEAALEALEKMRATEGASLQADLLERVADVERRAGVLEARSGEVQQAVRERLRRRAVQLEQEIGLLDEARLHQELVLAADRLDITEEAVRLRSHVEQFRCIVQEGDAGKPVGRRLDFLLQEFGREANTIGSKGSDAPIAHEIVELKAQIERLREQVQNVE